MRSGGAALALLSGLAISLAAGRACDAEPLTIRAGWVVTPSTMMPILFLKKEVLKHYGTSYVVDTIHFGSTSPEITALAAGELDIASLAVSSFAAAVQNARMSDLRIVADGFQDGVEHFYSSQYFVRRDSPIQSVEDLRGKILASNGIGGAIDMGMRNMLREHHLDDKKDYTIVEAQFPSMIAMLAERKVDLIGLVPPFAYDPRLRQEARLLFTMKDAVAKTQMIVYGARAGFLDKNRVALNDFFEDFLRAVHWYLDPANRAEAIEIVARFTKQPPANFADWLFSNADFFHDPQARPDLEAFQNSLEIQRKLGFLSTAINAKKYADLSFIEEAARRLH